MLWYFAYGKPREVAEADQHITISWQNEIVDRLRHARQRLNPAQNAVA